MHPYKSVPPHGYWKDAVAGRHFWDIKQLGSAKRKIAADDSVATAGSCFAQHISRRLRSSGYNFLDVEPAPSWLPAERRTDFGYGMFSARFGNIYSSRQMLQLHQRAIGKFTPQEDFWENGGRFFDPFRPSIEAGGFESLVEAKASQQSHLSHVAQMFRGANVFVFTLGLTELWRSKADGAAFPLCPGTQGVGTFDADKYEFVNLTVADVVTDMRSLFRLARARNPDLRFLLTVSPVPLVATASGQHVLTATTYSKSVLRAAAGELSASHDFVDYFPSYEIITSPAFRGVFFDQNLRDIRGEGVDFVMTTFFSEYCEPVESKAVEAASMEDPELVKCDEIALESFATL